MITLHSIDLRFTREPCFGQMAGNRCRVLSTRSEDCDFTCPFYKPAECRDWIRVEDRQGVNLIPPEEYRRGK